MLWELVSAREVDGYVAVAIGGHKGNLVCWVCSAGPPELVVQAGVAQVEPPRRREQAVSCGVADEGVGMVEVTGVEGEKVGVPDHWGGRDSKSPFNDVPKEMA